MIDIIRNGTFSGQDWSFFTNGIGTFTALNGYAHIAITKPGTNNQLSQNGLQMRPGRAHTLSFRAKSNAVRTMRVVVLKDVSPYTNYGLEKTVNLTGAWQNFTFTFKSSPLAGPDARLMFYFNNSASGATYDIDAVKLETDSAPVMPAAKYACSEGKCVESPAGQYVTLAECSKGCQNQNQNQNQVQEPAEMGVFKILVVLIVVYLLLGGQ
ncbi:MAG TPA: carbohydrate binding domain-containing protein [Candidatus Methylomirabilis sp.]|nr:carbohydrate binding domain-containing protein [Candidatus Methylomirabilis sp.]